MSDAPLTEQEIREWIAEAERLTPMTAPTPAYARAMLALAETATPGPWLMWDGYRCAGGTHPADEQCRHVATLGSQQDNVLTTDCGSNDIRGHRADWEFISQAREAVPVLARALLESRRLIEGAIRVMEQHDSVRDEQGGGPACGMEHPVILYLLRAFLASGPPDRLSGEPSAEDRP